MMWKEDSKRHHVITVEGVWAQTCHWRPSLNAMLPVSSACHFEHASIALIYRWLFAREAAGISVPRPLILSRRISCESLCKCSLGAVVCICASLVNTLQGPSSQQPLPQLKAPTKPKTAKAAPPGELAPGASKAKALVEEAVRKLPPLDLEGLNYMESGGVFGMAEQEPPHLGEKVGRLVGSATDVCRWRGAQCLLQCCICCKLLLWPLSASQYNALLMV